MKYYPLSKTEEGIYVSCLQETDAYNLAHIVNLGKDLDTKKFIKAVNELFNKHPYLFTKLHQDESGNVLKYIDKQNLDLKLVQLDNLNIESKPYKMLDNPLYRLGLFLVNDNYYFYFDFHHIIFDGSSINMFLNELSNLYDGKEVLAEEYDANKTALDEAKALKSKAYKEAKDYYEKLLDGVDIDSNLPFDKKDNEEKYNNLVLDLNVDNNKLKEFTKKNDIKTSSFFLGAFSFLLAKVNYDDKALFFTVHNGRNELNRNSYGMFVKTYPIVMNFEEKESVESFLKKINEENINNVKNNLYPLSSIVSDLGINSNIIFAYQGDYFYKTKFNGKVIEAKQLERNDGKDYLSIELHRDNGKYFVWVEYRSDLYYENTIKHLIKLFNIVLNELMSKKDLDSISLLDKEELALLDSFNKVDMSMIDASKTILDYFEENVKKDPKHLCVCFKDNKYTYSEVDDITNRIAKKLKSLGVGTEDKVSVLIKKSEHILIDSLGVLKAGGAYQPLDPTYPKERLNFMVRDASSKVLILDRDLDDIIEDFKGPKLYTDELFKLPDSDVKLDKPKPSDLFIMLYTSGTTGLPKGVMLEHKAINAFISYHVNRYGFNSSDSVAAYASYGFDADMMDLYTAMVSGGTLYVIPEELRLDLVKLGEYFEENHITTSLITTQVGRQFVEEIECKSLKHLFTGGEKLVPVQPPKHYILHNAYGPTEGTVYCTEYTVDKLYYRVPIGKMLCDYKGYVLDKNFNRLPYNVAGELYISGPQIGRGYLNREKESKEAFLENPFDNDKEFKKLYKTGDIVRFLDNGVIDFIGRKDGQVKIRGFRVELTEVEQVIREYPGIKDATVKDFTDPAGVKFICAYVVSDSKVDIDKLNKFIGSKKPPYMIPAYTMQLEKIPLNQNQKVNKRALPLPELKQEEIVPPSTETEKELFELLSGILGHKSFGVTTDIYEAGLTSVSSIRLTVNLAKKYHKDVSSSDLKENNTIKKLATFVLIEEETKVYEKQKFYNLTKTQEGIFVESISKPNSTIYNIPYLFKLNKKHDLDKLEESVKNTINNHPYLKMTLMMNDDGDILVTRNDESIVNIERIKADKLPNDLIQPFEIVGGVLYRVKIIECIDANYLYLDFHHILCDGTSEAIILSDINKSYKGEKLEPESFTGFEVSLEEKDDLNSDKLGKAKDFIASLLKDIDGEYTIKKDLKITKESKLLSNDYIYDLDSKLVKEFSDKNKVTLNAYFNFAFAFALSKYLYKEDVLYETIYNGRNKAKLNNTVSMLVKTLPVYIKYEENSNVIEKLKEMTKLLSDLQANDLYAFSDIASAYDLKSDVIFAYQGDSFTFNQIGGLDVEPILLTSDTPKCALSVDVFLENGKFRCHIEYDSSYYNKNTIDSLSRLYELVLNELLNKESIKDINTLSKFDLDLYDKFNQTKVELENTSFNKLVERQAKLHPDKMAVLGKGKHYTYKEFNEDANKVAHTLVDNGVKIASKVVMLMPRITTAYVVRQGIIKSGGAFVPIDPKYPDDRVSYIIENSGATHLVSTREVLASKKDLLKTTNIKAFAIEDILESKKIDNLDLDIPNDSLCYIIYTSGSTGKPKGVMISHHNLINYVSDGCNLATYEYRIIKGDVISCSFASFAFDASLQEECIVLSHGYTAVIATEEEIENPMLLSKTLQENHVNIMFMTPSFVSNMLEFDVFVDALKNFQVLDMGAEVVPAELVKRLRDLGITATIDNGYGPTETTITSTMHLVTDEYITIGKPLANTKLYLLDKAGHILPINAIGDLTIAGDCVGMGYLGMKDKTEEKFINVLGLRAYRSGDLARYNGDGNIEFFGRLDNQVKLRGLRVELDEIEKVLNSYPNITRSIIVVKNNSTDGDYLAAYFTAKTQIDKDALTSHMSKSLTPYMIPKVMMQLDKIPLTPNGKIDKKALPEIRVEVSQKEIKKPQNKLQEDLAAIFAKALGKQEIGVDEDFFDLGGTSLSASKIAMMAIQKNLPIAYKDVFEYSTVLELEAHINSINGKDNSNEEEESVELEALKYNNIKNVDEINRDRDLGRVLLTGSTGFLGIHVIRELLAQKRSVICLIRGKELTPRERLMGLLAYYFDSPLEEEVNKYIEFIDADVTDENLYETLKDKDFQTIINCAALVKHFAKDDIIERINYGGVKNLIGIAKKMNARLIQISTLSVAGENIDMKFEYNFRMKENMLEFGQDISNKYVHSKYMAEKAILEEIPNGLDGKIIRVGNLMGRNSDGEFQANSITNGFMRDLKSYAFLHKFPVNSMFIGVDFTPIDEVAKTILLLSQTKKEFTVFHSSNSHEIQMGDVIYKMNKLGFNIDIVSDQEFNQELAKWMEDENKNMLVSSLISYSSSDAHLHSFILTNNDFTNLALYHLGYKWPITDDEYLEKAIKSLKSLDFFERTDI